MAIRIFEVNLFHTVYTYRWFLGRARPVSVLNLVLVEVGDESVDVLHAETEMIIPVAFVLFFLALDQVQMPGSPDREPSVLAVVKRFRDLLQAEDALVELRACLQVRHIDANVIQCHRYFRIGR